MTAIDEQFYHELIANDTLLSWLGVELESVTEGELVMTVPFSEKVALSADTPGMGGTAHAGVLATLVDMAGEVLRTKVDSPESTVLATTDLDVTYLRPVTDDIRVVGVPVRVGSSVAVSDVSITSSAPDGTVKQVVVGRGSYQLLSDV